MQAGVDEKRANILIVDDHPANLVALGAVLEPLGQRRTPIIFLTGTTLEKVHVSQGYAQGAGDYLLKPYDPDVLRSKVGAFLDLHLRWEEVKRREKALSQARAEESERQFRTLADSIPQLAWMADETGFIFWYNQRWYDYTGTTFEGMKGWGWKSVHAPEEVAGVEARFRAAIASGQPWEDTFPLRRKDGEFRWHLSRAMPVREATGRIVRWFGTNTDVEDSRRQAAELRQAVQTRNTFLSVARALAPHAERSGSRLQVDASGAAVGRLDRMRVRQIVTNLLSNTLKFGAGKPIHIALTAGEKVARLTVRDEGIGIEPVALERIFQKFERAVSERNYGGLGLYVTKQLVEAMGGTVKAESTLGQGATFVMELPLAGAGKAG